MSEAEKSAATIDQLRADYELYSANFLRVVDKQTGELIPFRWNKPQRKIAAAVKWQEERKLPIRIVILKSRKVGASTWVQGFIFHRTHLRENRDAITLAHVAESSGKLFEMSRRFYDWLAKLPAGHPLQVTKRHLTRKQITFSTTMSSAQVLTVGGGAGRAFTAFYVHGSEVAHWDGAKETLLALKNSVPKIPDSAVFLESTPKGWGNEFHNAWRAATGKMSGYLPVFIAWFDDPVCQLTPWFTADELDAEEQKLVADHGVTLRQLAWRRDQIANECDGDKDLFRQEFPSDPKSCFLHSGRPVFDEKGLEYQLSALPEPDAWEGMPPASEIRMDLESKRPVIEVAARGRIRMLKPPIPRHTYIIGIDPSEGDPGSDPSPISVFDCVDFDFPCLFYGQAPPDVLAEYAVLMGKYYNEGKMIWEANNHGLAFGLTVMDLGYSNIYYRKVSDESVSGKETDKAGYWSTASSRENLFNTLRKYVREAPSRAYPPVRHPQAVNEFLTLVYEKEKAQAQEGEHDDFCVSAGLCLFCHRGSMENPLEPIPIEEIRAVLREHRLTAKLGEPIDPEKLLGSGVTCKDLEDYDQMVYNRRTRKRRWGTAS